jgi:TonB family protein
MAVPTDVFTIDEIARAAGVSRDSIRDLIASGAIRPIEGTAFFTADEAVQAGKQARNQLRAVATPPPSGHADGIFATVDRAAGFAERRGGMPAFASSCVHATFIVTMLWLTSGATESAPVPSGEQTRLVFLARPGPGGGGGGGGLKNPLPPRPVETRGPRRTSRPVPAVSPDKQPISARRVEVAPPVPKPTPKPTPEAEPLPSKVLIAPVAAAASTRQQDGVVQRTRNDTDSVGKGTDGGAGSGRGTGSGEGVGPGLGPGTGGGTGGGPYRAGSGIEPPRLLREVKAQYTEDARRRGLVGAVILEIVINASGTVTDVSVRRGLGAGLDERAVEAVRQWKFSPARRQGQPVDVIVEVAVEFAQR